MKQKYYIGFIALVLANLFVSCVHDYPTLTEDGSEGIDPTLVEVNTEVTLDLELLPLQINRANKVRNGTARPGTKAVFDPDTVLFDFDTANRFIVEAWREGKVVGRQETVMKESEGSNQKISLPVNLRLHAVEHTLGVWMDRVFIHVVDSAEAGSGDTWVDRDSLLGYKIIDLQNISAVAYRGNADSRDCFYGTAALDLRPYRNQWNSSVQVGVAMERPVAKYELVATDAAEFLEKTQRQRAGGATYAITVRYGFYFPLGFNVLTGTPERSEMGVEFTAPLTVTDNGNGECTIASDCIFVNGEESYIPLSIEIKDAEGNGISRTTGIDVSYRRGHLTTMRGRFLTNRYDTGIGINPDFDDEDIDIDLDLIPMQ